MPRNNFENILVRSLNQAFEDEGIQALAYRLKQARFCSQNADIIVDSNLNCWYLAIECKSVKKGNNLYFSSYFSSGQIEAMTAFCNISGRTGYLAVDIRGPGKHGYLIPWNLIYLSYKSGSKQIKLENFERYQNLKWNKDLYTVLGLFNKNEILEKKEVQ